MGSQPPFQPGQGHGACELDAEWPARALPPHPDINRRNLASKVRGRPPWRSGHARPEPVSTANGFIGPLLANRHPQRRDDVEASPAELTHAAL
eukprot:5134223-Alexandrium_andersonii.AAC.1